MLLQNIISQSNFGSTEEFVEILQAIPNLLRVGDGELVKPCVIWQDGKTFFSADKPNAGFKNQIIAIQIDHNSGSLFFADVGVGTEISDEFNHPVPYLWAENNHVYIGQTNTHNDPIDIFKSNDENDIRSGFTKLTSIPGLNAYPQLFKANDDTLVILVRVFSQGVGNFNLAIQKSNSGIEGVFSELLLTENTVGYRHYPSAPNCYGTQTKNFIATDFRNDDFESNYFAAALYETTDFITFSNYQGTFSKNVVLNGPLTMAEIDANYMINGNTANDLASYGFFNFIIVNDVLYGIGVKESTTEYYLYKIENGELETVLLNVPNIAIQFYTPFIYYNGLNLIISVRTDDTITQKKELWGVSTDLLIQTKVYEFTSVLSFGRPIYLPDNLDQVNGEYAMCVDSAEGEAIFIKTSNKFFI